MGNDNYLKQKIRNISSDAKILNDNDARLYDFDDLIAISEIQLQLSSVSERILLELWNKGDENERDD